MEQHNAEDDQSKETKKPIVIRNSTDLQRLKLEKLMKHPDKLVIIPEGPKERGVPIIPDFVRNVMGSSAGAGSGEFHVYRHLRRKEFARQRYMKEKGERERLDDEYRQKLEENKKLSEERTDRRRKKRLNKKKKQKSAKKSKPETHNSSSESESGDGGSEVDKVATNVQEDKDDIIIVKHNE